jgi:hypothetical protein
MHLLACTLSWQQPAAMWCTCASRVLIQALHLVNGQAADGRATGLSAGLESSISWPTKRKRQGWAMEAAIPAAADERGGSGGGQDDLGQYNK